MAVKGVAVAMMAELFTVAGGVKYSQGKYKLV